MDILPGVGVGEIKFGMLEPDVISILGKPDEIKEDEYASGSGDIYRMLSYFSLNLDLSFDKEDDFKLGSITISGHDFRLFGQKLFDKPMNLVKSFVSKIGHEIPKHEDFTIDDSDPRICLDYDTLGMLFWFGSGKLTEIDCRYFFEEDGETEIWP